MEKISQRVATPVVAVDTPWGIEHIPKGCGTDRPKAVFPQCGICEKELLNRERPPKWTDPYMQMQAGGHYCGWCYIEMNLLTGQSWVGYNHD